MSEMLERVAKVIQDVLENPRYVVKIGKLWEVWDDKECLFSSNIHARVDEECDRLNTEYIARKAVEALKPATGDLERQYYEMASGEGYRHYDACFPNAAWERAIDAILIGG